MFDRARFTLDIPAWDAGYAAGEAGELDSCPYPPSSRESLSWHAGFIEGRTQAQTRPDRCHSFGS